MKLGKLSALIVSDSTSSDSLSDYGRISASSDSWGKSLPHKHGHTTGSLQDLPFSSDRETPKTECGNREKRKAVRIPSRARDEDTTSEEEAVMSTDDDLEISAPALRSGPRCGRTGASKGIADSVHPPEVEEEEEEDEEWEPVDQKKEGEGVEEEEEEEWEQAEGSKGAERAEEREEEEEEEEEGEEEEATETDGSCGSICDGRTSRREFHGRAWPLFAQHDLRDKHKSKPLRPEYSDLEEEDEYSSYEEEDCSASSV
jgi:hypothetical protein